MQTSKYRVFIKVVEEKSITRAAEDLNYTQSGVSHIIKSLEQELGFRLLFRSNVDVRLTKEGEAVYDVIKSIADGEERLLQLSSGICDLQMGHIAIGTFCSVTALWLPEMIRTFLERYPKIKFTVRDSDYDETEKLLEDDVLDCAFLPQPNSKVLKHTLLTLDPYYAVVPDSHEWCGLESVPVEKFSDEQFIVPCEGMNYSIGRLFREKNIRPQIGIRARDDLGTLAFVRAGLGVTILSEMYLESAGRDSMRGLRALEIEPHMDRRLGLCVHKGRELSPAVKLFYDHVLRWVAEHGHEDAEDGATRG